MFHQRHTERKLSSHIFLLSILLIFIWSSFTFITFCSGHSSPHRPRSQRVAVHTSGTPGTFPGTPGSDHQHYVPQRPVPGSKGQQEKILTHDQDLLHDKEHLKEDLGEWVLANGELSADEMEFHYFRMHDFDNNSMLDGLEILQAISHILPMTELDGEESPDGDAKDKNEDSSATGNKILNLESQKKRFEAEMRKAVLVKQREEDFDYYIDLIDKVLQEDDLNKDGFLSYFEYVAGRRRDEREEKAKAHQAAMHSHTQMS